MDKKESFVMYTGWYDVTKHLDDATLGKLFRAINEHQDQGEATTALPPEAKMAFAFIKKQFEIDRKKYLEKCEKNRKNAGKRWGTDATASDGMGTDAKHADNDNESENENEFESENENDARLAHNLIFCFQKAYKHHFQTEYTITKADKEAAPLLAEKLIEVAEAKGDGYPWQWITKYFWKAMQPPVKDEHTGTNTELLNDFHYKRLSIAHILNHFDEIHKAVLHKVNPINKPEPGQSIDEILKTGETDKEINIEFERKSRYINDQMP